MAENSIVRLQTEKELEALHVETFINTTPLVTKVTDESVLRGLIRGNVKVGKKALKDIALAISHLFVDLAFDTALDEVAENSGIAQRFGAAQSSTWIRLVADPGTIYQQGINSVSDNKGNIFDLQDDITIDAVGYGYVKVRSQQSSASTNVDPYTIVNVNPEPSGHIGVINEYAATGGRDIETDDTFRQRIKEGPNALSRGTLSFLTQVFMNVNPNVLRVIYDGIDSTGKVTLSILTVNGIDLTDDELSTILDQCGQYFSLTELNPIGTTSYGVKLQNATYYPIDIGMRLSLVTGADLATVVKDIQQKFSKKVDFRFWNSSLQKIGWIDLLTIVKNTDGVKYVPDQYFTPNADVTVPRDEFPRFRGFIVRDLDGNILINQSGTLQPIFYANQTDQAFIASVV